MRKVYGGFMIPAKGARLRGIREASNGGRVRVRIIHGLNISQKELAYFAKSLLTLEAKYYYACS